VYIRHLWHLAQLRIDNYEVLAYPLAKCPMFSYPIKIIVRAWDKNDWKNCENMFRPLWLQTRRKDTKRKAIISLLYRFTQTSFSSEKLFSRRRLLLVSGWNFLCHIRAVITRTLFSFHSTIFIVHWYNECFKIKTHLCSLNFGQFIIISYFHFNVKNNP